MNYQQQKKKDIQECIDTFIQPVHKNTAAYVHRDRQNQPKIKVAHNNCDYHLMLVLLGSVTLTGDEKSGKILKGLLHTILWSGPNYGGLINTLSARQGLDLFTLDCCFAQTHR